jgi:nucleoside-diphosphate-sugar epimerase
MKALVIGGTRFVGAHVVIRLVDAGHDVTVLHRGITTHAALPKVRHAQLGHDWRHGNAVLSRVAIAPTARGSSRKPFGRRRSSAWS